MKVIAINGSARKAGNTQIMIDAALQPLIDAGFECESISLAGADVRGCTACGVCRSKKDGQCHGRKDALNEIIEKIGEADALILGSPTYFADVTAEMKALIDRVGYVNRGNDGALLYRKPAAAVVTMRRTGAIHAYDTMLHLFGIAEMITVNSNYWNSGLAGDKGAVAQDEEAMRTMSTLGENMAWLLNKIGD